MKKQSLPRAAQCMRAIRWVVLGATLAGAAVTFSPAAVQALSVSSDYIVVLRDGVNLSKKVASEEKRGNDVADTFSAGSDGFVASLDSSDVARLRKDIDIRIIERDAPVSLVSDNEPDKISALSAPNRCGWRGHSWPLYRAIQDQGCATFFSEYFRHLSTG